MTTKVHAVYRNGALLPVDPLPLAEGTQVELTVTTTQDSNIAQVLEQIALLPEEGPRDGFSGADHDQILYSKDQHP